MPETSAPTRLNLPPLTGVLARILFVIFVVEAAIMLVLAALPPLGEAWEMLIDASSLTVVAGTAIYLWVVRPSHRELNRTFGQLDEMRRLAENTASELKSRQFILEKATCMAVTNTDGLITSVNDAFCELTGYSREELIGQDHRLLKSGYHPAEFFAELYAAITSGRIWHGEVKNRKKDGSMVWLETTIVPVTGLDGKIKEYAAIRSDITERKRTEEELQNATAMARAANQAKSEFLANMSHEIRTPMTAILGFADLLLEDGDIVKAPQRRVEAVRTITRNGEHLLAIINDILDLSKIEAGRMSVERIATSPTAIVQEVLSLMGVRAIEKQLPLRVTWPATLPDKVLSDPLRVRQILMNLVGNAIKFTNTGAVEIRVSAERLTASEVELKFAVADTGIGMTPEQTERLFRAFSQADSSVSRKFGGTGLGLRISQRLATMLGGTLTVASEYERGTTVTLSLSVACDPTTPWVTPEIETDASKRQDAQNAISAITAVSLTGLRILLAEDGLDNQRLLTHVLKKAGADVCVVDNGHKAVEHLTIDGTITGELQLEPEFDIVLMDMQMPVMDGYTASALLRSKGNSVPVIALTAHAMAGEREKCISAGCIDYATKPIQRELLLRQVARWAKAAAPVITA